MINAAVIGLGRWGKNIVESVQGKSQRLHFIRKLIGLGPVERFRLGQLRKQRVDVRLLCDQPPGDEQEQGNEAEIFHGWVLAVDPGHAKRGPENIRRGVDDWA